MLPLRDVQKGLHGLLLGADAPEVEAEIAPDGLTPAARVAIYRYHVLTSLTEALESTYPVICRLVDRRFFAYAADTFIRREPPAGPCLYEYGAAFPAFLAGFPPCRDLPWLADVARLEWAMARARHAPDIVSLDPRLLAELEDAEGATLVLRLDPSVSFVGSRWPVDDVWRAHRGEGISHVVDVTTGPVEIEVRRLEDDVVIRRLDHPTAVFRRTLAAGQRLDEAAAAAIGVDDRFDPTAALGSLLAESLITGFALRTARDEGVLS